MRRSIPGRGTRSSGDWRRRGFIRLPTPWYRKLRGVFDEKEPVRSPDALGLDFQ